MVERPNGDGSGCVKRIIPMINTKTPDLVGVDEGVIQFRATVKGFIHDQNVCLPSSRIIPSGGARCNWHIREGLDRFVMCMHINLFVCKLEDGEIVTKAACISIGICFIS